MKGNNTHVWKLGAFTGPTSGFDSHFKSYCHSTCSLDSSVTQEILVLSSTIKRTLQLGSR